MKKSSQKKIGSGLCMSVPKKNGTTEQVCSENNTNTNNLNFEEVAKTGIKKNANNTTVREWFRGLTSNERSRIQNNSSVISKFINSNPNYSTNKLVVEGIFNRIKIPPPPPPRTVIPPPPPANIKNKSKFIEVYHEYLKLPENQKNKSTNKSTRNKFKKYLGPRITESHFYLFWPLNGPPPPPPPITNGQGSLNRTPSPPPPITNGQGSLNRTPSPPPQKRKVKKQEFINWVQNQNITGKNAQNIKRNFNNSNREVNYSNVREYLNSISPPKPKPKISGPPQFSLNSASLGSLRQGLRSVKSSRNQQTTEPSSANPFGVTLKKTGRRTNLNYGNI